MQKTMTSLIAAGILIIVAVLAVAIVGTVIGGTYFPPEIALTLVLILGVISLVTVIGALLSLLRPFGLADGREALGLPAGSIRAILALMLVLVFAIMSIFLYYQSKSGGSPSFGIEQAQLDLLPKDRILSIRAAQPGPSGQPRFDVEVQPPAESQQLALQLVTVLGTLVTAIAAFYFGSNSVTTALKSRDPDPSTLLIGSPEAIESAATAARALATLTADQATKLEKVRDTLSTPPKAGVDDVTERPSPNPGNTDEVIPPPSTNESP